MKKYLFILFVIAMVHLPAFSVISTEDTTSDTYIKNHGYSGEMSRLIDLQNSQINGVKPEVQAQPELYSIKPVSWARRAFMYFDCGLDDEKFMQHEIKYTTRYDSL